MTLPRRGSNTKNRQYFIPQFQCTEQFRAKNIPVEEQLDNDTLDQLMANVDFNQKEDDSLNRELKQARKDKILQQTKLIGQKLEQRKRLLFSQWSEKFFDSFADHFGSLKNNLISMHLNEQQIKTFNQCMDNCLNNLQLSLNQIWDDFNKEKQENTND